MVLLDRWQGHGGTALRKGRSMGFTSLPASRAAVFKLSPTKKYKENQERAKGNQGRAYTRRIGVSAHQYVEIMMRPSLIGGDGQHLRPSVHNTTLRK